MDLLVILEIENLICFMIKKWLDLSFISGYNNIIYTDIIISYSESLHLST